MCESDRRCSTTASGFVYLATLAVFVAVYVVIALRKVAGRTVPSYIPALIGGGAVLLIGSVTPDDAFAFIRWDTLKLLLGMMLLTAAMSYCGFFDRVAKVLMRRFSDRRGFLFAVTALTSVMCMVMLNDAVVLIFTPIVITCCRSMKVDPVPYVIAVFTGANIGCAATFVGAPHCALASSFGGVSFLQYSLISIPVVVLCTVVAAVMVRHHFAADIEGDFDWKGAGDAPAGGGSAFRMNVCIVILVAMLALFLTNDFTGFGLGNVAMVGGVLAAVTVSTAGRDVPVYVVRHVNWDILLFFIGLFVLISGVSSVGIVDDIARLFGMDGALPSTGVLCLFTAVLSNLISNVPAVMLIGQILSPLGAGTVMWSALAVISSFGANLTVIGSAANIIGIGEAEKQGLTVSFTRHLRLGVPLTVVTCVIATAYLYAVSLVL